MQCVWEGLRGSKKLATKLSRGRISLLIDITRVSSRHIRDPWGSGLEILTRVIHE
jgi:hypothetical protein